MGTTFDAIEVYTANRSLPEFRTAVMDAVRQFVLDGRFIETTAEGDRDPDRTVLIGPSGEGAAWLTVLDYQGDLRQMARHLSEAIQGTAVALRLIDSDVVHIRRYTEGRIVDDYCNAPELYDSYTFEKISDWGQMSAAQKRALKTGHPSRWRDLTAKENGASELGRLWKTRPILADDILWGTVEQLGMNADEIASDEEPENWSRLTFRLAEPRQYEVKAGGPPVLHLDGQSVLREVFVGDALDAFFMVRNDGGPAAGLSVIAWGTSLDQGLIDLQQILITRYTGTSAEPYEIKLAPRQGKLEERSVMTLTGDVDSFSIPEGIEKGMQAAFQPGVNWFKAYQAVSHTILSVHTVGTILKEGQGDLFVVVVPRENPKEGAAVYQASLQVLPAPRRPLRNKEAQHPIPSTTLHDLEVASHLFALAAFDADQERSAALTAKVIEQWVASNQTAGKAPRYTSYLRKSTELQAEKRKLASSEFPDGEQWIAIRSALATCVSFSIEKEQRKITFDANPLFFRHGHEQPSPQLGIFYLLDGLTKEQIREQEEGLIRLLDQIVSQGIIAQSLLGRWTWRGTYDLHATPYEWATSVSGQCTTGLAWCRKFLRGVTEHMWLGPELLARLGNLAPLRGVADVTPIGNGMRVFLKETATLDELERVLAILLPSEADWMKGVDTLYGRS